MSATGEVQDDHEPEDDGGEWHDDHDPEDGGEFYDPHNLIDRLPHEVGLPPLGCGQCGKSDIRHHPCPVCGYDPERDDEQQTLGAFADE